VSIILGCWVVACLLPLLAGMALPARDVAATQVPWRMVWREQVSAGRLPVWDPLSNQGRPLLANPNAMAMYPGTALFLLLAPEPAATAHIVAHHLLLLLGCTLLARRSGAAREAAVVAGAAVATSGVAWSSITFLNSEASLAWVVLAMATAVPPPARPLPRALLAGGALGLAFLAGEPVIAALGGLAWASVVAATWRPAPAASIALAAAAGCAVAAPVLVPLMAVYPDTMRAVMGVAPGALAADTLAPRRWLELVLPNLLGAPLGDGATGFWAAASFPWQRYFPLVFVGAVPLLTLPFARRRADSLAVWWALLAAAFGGAVLLSFPPIVAAAAGLPGGGSVRYGIKLLVLAVLGLPPLVAAGYERLVGDPRRRRRATLVLLAPCAVLTLLAAASPASVRAALGRLYPGSRPALALVGDHRLRASLVGDAAALAVPAGVLLVTAAPAPLTAAVLAAGAFAARGVLALDDTKHWRDPPALLGEVPARATVAAFAPAATPARTADDPALARFWSARAALVPEYGIRWGIGYVLTRGPDGLEAALQDLLAAEASHLPLAARVSVARALGAQAVISDEPLAKAGSRRVDGVWVTVLDDPAPLVYLARRELPCEGIPAAVQALASASFRPGLDAVTRGAGGAAELGSGSLTVLAGPPDRRRFRVDVTAPGLLVVQQSYMRCWRARVDGVAAGVEVANGAEIGVRMPAGTHAVELYVDRTPARIGLAGPLLLAFALIATRRRAGSSADPRDASDGGARSTRATPPER
jgi:hypothetical protein